MVHGNLCPENIILNKSGAWKIMGFDFSISSTNPSDAEVCAGFWFCFSVQSVRQRHQSLLSGRRSAKLISSCSYILVSCRPLQPKYTCKEWEPNLPPLCLPNPEYLAPEYILSVSCDSASDMYSLGVVVHAIFNEGKPVFQVNKHDIFKSFSRQLDQVSGDVRNVEAQQMAGLTHSSINLL